MRIMPVNGAYPPHVEDGAEVSKGRRAMMQIVDSLVSATDRVVRDGIRYRRIWSGMCQGCYLPIDPRHDLRQWLGLYEAELRPFVRRYAWPGACCYDIGAATGYYTLAFSRLAAPGCVYAIEAEEAVHQALRETLARNPGLAPRIATLNCFVGDTVEGGDRRVTIDHLVLERGLQPPDLIKVDVEGAEHAVLRGGREVIARFSPSLIIEVHSLELEERCLGFLGGAGYGVTVVDQNHILPEKRPLPHNRWLCAEVPGTEQEAAGAFP